MEENMTELLERKDARGRWKLSDAKARFSHVVRLAQKRPQRVTVDGEDAVVIVAASTYDKEHGHRTGEDLVKAFQHSAAVDFDFGREVIGSTAREADL